MLFTGMGSLQHNSVPVVTIFKNITNILVTLGDYTLFGSTTECLVVVAFVWLVLAFVSRLLLQDLFDKIASTDAKSPTLECVEKAFL